jgi:hypothetical protein
LRKNDFVSTYGQTSLPDLSALALSRCGRAAVNIEERYIKTYSSSIDARRSDLLRLVEENPDRVNFLHELQVHVEVLFDMTERMRQEIEKPEFELVGAPVGESIEEVG